MATVQPGDQRRLAGDTRGGGTDRTRVAPAVLAATLVAVPILADWVASGRSTPIRYFAPDAFYYHTVARNVAVFGDFTYDGSRPTNGFHPLWQLVLALVATVGRWQSRDDAWYLGAVLAIDIALVSAAVLLLGLALARLRGSVPQTYALVPFGLYGLLVLPYWIWAVDWNGCVIPSQGPFPVFGTIWSYVNGMESGLVLLAFSCLALAHVALAQGSLRGGLLIGGLSGALALARLDHILIAAPFALGAGIQGWQATGRLRRLLLPPAILAAVVLAYLTVTFLYSGAALPVSGTAKTSFPQPIGANFENLARVLTEAPVDVLAVSRFYRASQLFVPMVAAAAVLVRYARGRRSSRPDDFERFMVLAGIGVLALASYNALFVAPFHMGSWYFPVSTLLVSLLPYQRAGQQRIPSRSRLASFGFVLVVAASFALWHRRPGYHSVYSRFFYEEAPALKARLGTAVPHILEMDDGIVAFATGFPAMSGTGLALDVEGARAAQENRLLELALARGFDHVASLVYLLPTTGTPAPDPAARLEEASVGFRASHPVVPVHVVGGSFFVLFRVVADQPAEPVVLKEHP